MKSLLIKQYIITGTIIVLFGGSLFALIHFISVMEKKKTNVIQAREHLASFEQNKRIFAEEAKEFEVIRQRIDFLEKNIITNATVPTVLSSIETMAKEKQIDFVITTVDTVMQNEIPSHLHIDFSASGTFDAINAFITTLLSQSYEVRFSRFSMYVSEESSSEEAVVPSVAQWQLLAGIDIISF